MEETILKRNCSTSIQICIYEKIITYLINIEWGISIKKNNEWTTYDYHADQLLLKEDTQSYFIMLLTLNNNLISMGNNSHIKSNNWKYTYKITIKKEIILQSVNLPVSNPSLSNWFCEMLLFFVTALAVFLLFFRSFWWLLSLLKEILWMKNLSRMVHKGPWCQNAYHLSLLSAEWQSRQ